MHILYPLTYLSLAPIFMLFFLFQDSLSNENMDLLLPGKWMERVVVMGTEVKCDRKGGGLRSKETLYRGAPVQELLCVYSNLGMFSSEPLLEAWWETKDIWKVSTPTPLHYKVSI